MGGGSVGRVSIDIDVSGAVKAINKLRGELSALERAKFAPGTKAASAAEKEINKLNKSIHDLGGTVDKSGNFINRHAVAINQLAFSAARAGSGFANFLPLFARLSTLAAKHEFGEGGLGGALSSLKEKFSDAGSAAAGLASEGGKAAGAMGALKGAAGSASGALSGISFSAVAAVAAVAALVIGIGFLTVKLGPLGSALTKAQNSIKLIFEDAGQDMLDFARTASTAFGITEQAALRFVGKTGQLFKSFGIGSEGAGQLSKALLVTADVLRSTSTEFINSEDALQAVFDTVAGNVEGLRRFDIFLSEIGLTQVALRNGLKDTAGALDNVQRSLVSQIAAIEQAKLRYEQYRSTMDSTQRTAERTKAAFDSIKASIGQGFAPILSFVSNILLGLVVVFKDVVNAIGDFIKRNEGLVKALKAIAAEAIAMTPGLNVLAKVLGFLSDKGKNAAEDALSFDDSLAELNKGLEEARNQFNNYNKVLTTDQINSLIDAHVNLRRAVRDAAKAISEAELNLTRTLEDNARKRADAQRDLAEAYRDRNRAIADANAKLHDAEVARNRAVFDATKNLAEAQLAAARSVFDAREKLGDAEENRRRGIFDARRRLDEVELQGARNIRDAEERISEERLDIQERIAEAEKRIQDLRRQQAFDLVSSFRAIEDAQKADDIQSERAARFAFGKALRGDDITDARDKLNQEIGDSEKKLAELERDLAEKRMDVKRDLEDAHLSLRRAIEDGNDAVSDAQRDLERVFVDTQRKMQDAEIALERAIVDGDKSIADARESLARVFVDSAEKIAEAQRKLHETEVETSRAMFDAQNDLTEARLRGNEAINDATLALQRMNTELGTESLNLHDLNKKLNETRKLLLALETHDLPGTFGRSTTSGVSPGGFAHGGNYPAGVPRIVGELGPELEIPGHSGSIISNDRILRALESLGGGRGGESRIVAPSVTINQAGRNAEDLAFAISARLAEDALR